MQPPPDSSVIYQERLPQVRRRFELRGDRIEVEARWTLGRRYRTVLRLADLSPQAARFTIRNKWFKKSVMTGAIAIGAALFLSRNVSFLPARWGSMFCWAAAGVSLVVAVQSFRKRPFAHFPRKDGRPGLDVCGTDPEAFEAFLREVQARIRRA